MSEFKTFNGKSVDEAMEEACRHFGVAREKLEIEILSGGSSGIFGLVGKKKAQVKARLREEINLRQEMAGQGKRNGAPKSEPAPKPQKPARPPKAAEDAVAADAPREDALPEPAPQTRAKQAPRPTPVEAQRAMAEADLDDADYPDDEDICDVNGNVAEDDGFDTAAGRAAPRRESRAPREERRPAPSDVPPQPMTPELEAIVREVMEQMLDGILGQIPEFEISGHSERVSVLILDEENSGLLIGREGQTLSSIQYLVNRIVIRRHGNPVKVQINTGEYRERQDDNLRKMAIFLADKAKTLGRPQSTKPLSSYHRRVVHLALQEDEAISTRSKGDGPLKRVLIVPRGGRGEAQNNQRS
jgi:spoIIIJ-associated protein